MKKLLFKVFTLAIIGTMGVFSLIPEAHARLIFSTEDDGTVADSTYIDQDGSSTTFINLGFGADLTHSLRYDVQNDKFIINEAVDFSGFELLNFRINNESTAPLTCEAGAEGQMYYDTDTNDLWFCNGTAWTSLAAGSVGDDSITGAKLHPDVAGVGLVQDGSGNLDVSLSEVGEAVVNVANDSIIIIDADASNATKKESVADFVAGITDTTTMASSTGTIGIKDAGVTLTQVAEREVTHTLTPEFENFTLSADGADNTGTMIADYDSTAKRNFYKWSAKNSSVMQDYDLVLQWAIPENMQGFSLTNPEIEIDYKTDTSVSTDNKLDVSLLDAAGTTVTLTGGTALASSTGDEWVDDTDITFTGGTWTAGEYLTLIIKMSSKATSGVDLNPAYIGQIKFNIRVK